MSEPLTVMANADAGLALAGAFGTTISYLMIFAGFSLVIFVHELGHFIAAKLSGVRVDKFAIGFGRELFGFTYGETRYAFNILPLGGFVKMLGQEDFDLDKSGELMVKADPRAFTHKPIGIRMIIVSAGVFMNIVFAAATFSLVFMIGWETTPAEVGQIQAGMPADLAGLQIGDRIVRVNRQTIADWSDLQTATVLGEKDKPLELTYERKDPATGEWKTDKVLITPEMSPENNVLRIGVAGPSTNDVGLVFNDPGTPADQQIKPGDKIVAVNGKPTTSFWEISALLVDLKGEPAMFTVERTEPAEGQAPQPAAASQPSVTKQLQIVWRAHQYLMPTGKADEESGHLLGLVPRRRVRQAIEGQRADLAGIKTGDIIARWGGQIAPRLDEIITSRRENPDREIRVIVYRPGEGEKNVNLVPRGTGPLGRGVPSDGLSLDSQENDRTIIADIVTDVTDKIKTPAAPLKDVMPRGSLLTKVNDQPIGNWTQLSQAFTKLAGTKVKLAWTSAGAGEQSGEIYVPHTIGTTFDLPGSRQILSIGGISRREVEVAGRRLSLSVNNWRAASEVINECIEKGTTEVKVVYADAVDRKLREATVHLLPEMADTWVLRTTYNVDDIFTFQRHTVIRETNPFKASLIGLRKTWYFIEQVYVMMQRMIFERTMSVDQVSGPVGILQFGSQAAAAGPTVLMYFLALISANLAVINFLPLPIMDGGVFLFLLIEKIKGSPLSMRVQVATQLIGLVLIIGIFLFVTFQDFHKLLVG